MLNPYEVPQATVDGQLQSQIRPFPVSAWLAVFCLNLILPLLFGYNLTVDHGRFGALSTVVMFAGGGVYACFAFPRFAKRMFVGSCVVAATQFLGILHLFFGLIALEIAENFGQARGGTDQETARITTELGGVLTATITGAMLVACAILLGYAILFVSEKRNAKRDVTTNAQAFR